MQIGSEADLHHNNKYRLLINRCRDNRDESDVIALFRDCRDGMDCQQVILTSFDDVIITFRSRADFEKCAREVEKHDDFGLIDSLIKFKSDGNLLDTDHVSSNGFIDLLKASSQKSGDLWPRMKPKHEIVIKCKDKQQKRNVYRIMKKINGITCTLAYKDEKNRIRLKV